MEKHGRIFEPFFVEASFVHLAKDTRVSDYQKVDVTVTNAAPSSKLMDFDDLQPQLDDLLVLIREDERIDVVEGEDDWTVTLPDDAILFENTAAAGLSGVWRDQNDTMSISAGGALMRLDTGAIST